MLREPHQNILCAPKRIEKSILRPKISILIITIGIQKLCDPKENRCQLDIKKFKSTF